MTEENTYTAEDYYVFESWLNGEHEWKSTKHKKNLQPNFVRDNKVTSDTTLLVKLKPWELKLIHRALVGRLIDDDDELMAKKLGYMLLKYQLEEQFAGEQYYQRMSGIVREELEIIEEEMEPLVDKTWRKLNEIGEDENE